MRVLKHIWTRSLQACSHQAVFHNYLNGLCSPSSVTSQGLLSLSWSSIPLPWRILVCIIVAKVKLKASSHTSPWLFLLFTDCIVWMLPQSAKWGWVSLSSETRGHLVSEDYWFFSVPMKCLWPEQLLLEARSPLSNRTRLFFLISPQGWRGCRCLFWLWPIVTVIYLWALVPGLALAPVQSPAWCCKSFCLMLVCMKGT